MKFKEDVNMKKICYAAILIFILTGCSSGRDSGDDRVLAQINQYKMTVGDLRYELGNVPYDEAAELNTERGRKDFIDRVLEKEILLQEAQRQGLDRGKDFMKSIEKYWEQALLKLLLQRKAREISGSMHVYDNEIEEYCRNTGEKLPFPKAKNDIEKIIRQDKETKAMNAWIEELKKKSQIKINKNLLQDVVSGR